MNSFRIGGKGRTFARAWQWAQWQVIERRQPLNSCRGVFETFADAIASAPRTKPLGYDAANAVDWYTEKQEGVSLDDYPAVFWLREAFASSRTVFEIGGHVGIAYYGFEHVLTYPADLVWTIQDVPSIVTAGRELARARGRTNLHFVTDVAQVDGADVLLAAGSLQYVDSPSLAGMISGFTHKPRHVIVNTTPMYNGASYVTLQNIGTAYCPYRIQGRDDFIASLTSLGYERIAEWRKDRAVRIPDHPEKSVDHYFGFYFRLS